MRKGRALVLEVRDITVRYSGLPVLRNVSISVAQGRSVSVVGANGAGKSTLLKAIMGTAKVVSGSISFMGRSIDRLPTEQRVRMGLVYVPEGRRLFKPLSVEENLKIGAYLVRSDQEVRRRLQFVYTIFPRLAERRAQAAGSLSGGEQQMLAIGRGLMSGPRLLMLDEPSLGLAPIMVSEVFETIRRLEEEEGLTVLLVEQNVREALELTSFGYVLQSGEVQMSGPSRQLLGSEEIRKAFLGM